MQWRDESGMALIVTIMATLLLAAIGAALLVTSSTEALIAANYRVSLEALYIAESAAERVICELAAVTDWNPIFGGTVRSLLIDGSPSGTRVLADASTVDVGRAINVASCEKPVTCTATDLEAVTTRRPWGRNNPVWQPYAYGPAASFGPGLGSQYFALVMIGDDAAENDDDPLRDGATEDNPGKGVAVVRAEAFGPRNVHRVVELTVAVPGPRLVGWREVR